MKGVVLVQIKSFNTDSKKTRIEFLKLSEQTIQKFLKSKLVQFSKEIQVNTQREVMNLNQSKKM